MNCDKNVSKKRKTASEQVDTFENKKIFRSKVASFDWENLCFICGSKKRNGIKKLTEASSNSGVKQRLFNAATIRQDALLLDKLSLPHDLSEIGARYHAYPCYQNYVSENTLRAISKNLSSSENNENSMMGNAGGFLEEPVLADEDNRSSPAPSLSFCEPNVRKTLEEVIDQVCGIDDDDKGYLEYPGNEEGFDNSDADPDYIQESVIDSDNDIPKKKLQTDTTALIAHESGREILKNKLGRKSLKNETRLIREERKQNRNLGLSYTTKSGKVIKPRTCQELLSCPLKCKDRITEEKRQEIFKEYWSLASFNKRVSFIARLITTDGKKTTKRKLENKKLKNRLLSHKYFLPLNGQLVNVCQSCFLKTFNETKRFLTDVTKNKISSTSAMPHDDLRGLASPSNKTPEQDIQLVRVHIGSIPTYESHYCRRDSSKIYLPHYYTLTRMYEEYKKWLPHEKTPVSKFKYQEVFHSMEIKIKQPKKDTYATCDKYHMLLKKLKMHKKCKKFKIFLIITNEKHQTLMRLSV
ncbi:unnamed protein product [Diabrotica balteata]|uniref:Uncharacterized protein n=1 Tax=Diabrotica balteata TaxID=107213 RepID=A0A9N9TDC8_DIABA|nr:unnamed protein product [Diabrotica balteata]